MRPTQQRKRADGLATKKRIRAADTSSVGAGLWHHRLVRGTVCARSAAQIDRGAPAPPIRHCRRRAADSSAEPRGITYSPQSGPIQCAASRSSSPQRPGGRIGLRNPPSARGPTPACLGEGPLPRRSGSSLARIASWRSTSSNACAFSFDTGGAASSFMASPFVGGRLSMPPPTYVLSRPWPGLWTGQVPGSGVAVLR